MGKLYQRLFPECAANGLSPFECPGVVFVFLGVVNILIILLTFFIGRQVASDELILLIIFGLSIAILLISYNVSSGLRRIAMVRRELEDERKKIATIVSQLSDGLLFLSQECRILLVNKRAEELLGIQEREVLGLPRGKNLYETFPSLLPILEWCPTPQELKNAAEFEPVEIQVEHPAKRTLRVTTAGIRNAEGEIMGFTKTLHDTSKEKELDEMKSEFLSVTSHQLRTPLSSLRWLLELLRKGRLGEMTEEQMEVVKKMDDMNLRMIALVEDLLGATRVEQGQMQYEFGVCQIENIIQQLIEDLQSQVAAKNLSLSADLQDDLPELNCDEKKIRLVVQNLVENAIRYTTRGSIVVRAFSENDQLTVEVQDTGIGLDDDEKRKIFMKFYRGKRARQLEPEGTGLGLYLIQNIVRKHGGTLSVDSERGKGSTFRVTFPLASTS